MSAKLDLHGRVFGRLTVVCPDGSRTNKSRWICQCECGKVKSIMSGSLMNGRTTSCGCYRSELLSKRATKHGATAGYHTTREYRVWQGIHRRCGDSNNPAYWRYGGRGIKVCKEWASFQTFLADMGKCPQGCSIDRIDNDGDYSPANCRWATSSQQARNKANTLYVAYRGETIPLATLAESLGVNYYTFRDKMDLALSRAKEVAT